MTSGLVLGLASSAPATARWFGVCAAVANPAVPPVPRQHARSENIVGVIAELGLEKGQIADDAAERGAAQDGRQSGSCTASTAQRCHSAPYLHAAAMSMLRSRRRQACWPVPAALALTTKIEPPSKLALPVTVKVPGASRSSHQAAMQPLAMTLTLPVTVPCPASMPSEFTVTSPVSFALGMFASPISNIHR